MKEFEDELRAALRREEAPGGFTGRVLARAASRGTPRRTRWIGVGIAACLLLSAGGVGYRQYEGRKAKKELLLALEIAGSKLHAAQQRVSVLSQRTIHD